MDIVKAIVLGLLQGLTEFLPVSSSGHLLIVEKMGLSEPSLFFNVMLHLGTLLSVFIIFHKKIGNYIFHPIKSDFKYLILACIPTVIIAMLFKMFGDNLLMGDYLPIFFMITAMMLICASKFYVNKKRTLNMKNSILTGVFQGFAVLPGISRSGATISCLMLCGMDKKEACDFSFMLSIPIILGGAIVELIDINFAYLHYSLLQLVVGILSSCIGGILALKFLYNLIQKKSFMGFGVYMAIVSILLLFFSF